LHGTLERFNTVVGDGWPCWALSNHDCERSASRWGGTPPNPRLLRLAAAFQASLRGTVCLYQGEELGLPEAQLAFEDLQDPYGITMWPEFKGRDGCRTPMPWAPTHPTPVSPPAPSPGCRWPRYHPVRIRCLRRPLGLRQVHAPAADRGARNGDGGQHCHQGPHRHRRRTP
jgi:glycosidase